MIVLAEVVADIVRHVVGDLMCKVEQVTLHCCFHGHGLHYYSQGGYLL